MTITVSTVDELTPELLTGLLGLPVATVTTEPFSSGNMGTSCRLRLTYASGAEGPPSVVAKTASPDPVAREGNAYASLTEVGFYSELAARLDVASPHCYHAGCASDGAFLLLLEDLSSAVPGDQILGCTPEQARVALLNIAGLHASSWGREDYRTLPFLAPLGADIADAIHDVLVTTTPAFIDRYTPAPEDTEILRIFAEAGGRWIRGRTERFSLVHNDYRLDNLLFDVRRDSARPAVAVDWASLGVGLPARDVAMLLATGLDPAPRRRHEHDLVEAYNAALNVHRHLQSGAESFGDYVYGLFHPILVTVLGAMMSRRTERGDKMFAVMLSRSCAAVRDLQALDLLP